MQSFKYLVNYLKDTKIKYEHIYSIIKVYITKQIHSGNKDENLIGVFLDVLIKFSENPISVEQNINIFLRELELYLENIRKRKRR